MKLFFEHLFKTPMFLILILIVVIYGMPALGKTAELNRYAVVTAVGIDKTDEGEDGEKFEVSLLAFVPVAEQSFAETYRVISSKGRSVSEAMDLAGLNVGREIGLSHVKTVVLNSELLSEDISKFLDYLSRSEHLAASTKLIATDSSAKDFLNAVQKLDSESSIKISELINYNNDYIYSADSSFELFFKGYFGPTRVSLMPFLSIEDKGNGFAVSASGENGGSGNTQTASGKGQEIQNKGETILFKDGKEVAHLSGLDMKKINLMSGTFKTGSIEVENYTGGQFKNSNLVFEIFDKDLQYKATFENGIPVILLDIKLTLSLSEIETENGMIEENAEFYVISEDVTKAVEKVVRTRVAEAVEIMRDHQTDIPDFYTLMHNTNKKAFNDFLSNLEDKDNYLSDIVFKIGVTIYSK